MIIILLIWNTGCDRSHRKYIYMSDIIENKRDFSLQILMLYRVSVDEEVRDCVLMCLHMGILINKRMKLQLIGFRI